MKPVVQISVCSRESVFTVCNSGQTAESHSFPLPPSHQGLASYAFQVQELPAAACQPGFGHRACSDPVMETWGNPYRALWSVRVRELRTRAGKGRNGKEQLNPGAENCGSFQGLAVCLSLCGLCKPPPKRLRIPSRRCETVLRQSTPTSAVIRTGFASRSAPWKKRFSAHIGTTVKAVSDRQIFWSKDHLL